MREEEIKRLAEFIRKRAKKESAKVFDRDFFVVGDFNIEQDGDRFFKALEDQNFVMPLGRRTNFARTKTYDRIVWVKRKSFAFTNEINVVPFGKVLFPDKAAKGGKKGDQRPFAAVGGIRDQQADPGARPGPQSGRLDALSARPDPPVRAIVTLPSRATVTRSPVRRRPKSLGVRATTGSS